MAQHDDVVRDSFSRQAVSFASSPWVADEARINRLIAAATLTGNERVLEIAAGPGYIAEAFARKTQEVIATDLTKAMLDIAEERTRQRGVTNISFQVANAEQLPFEDEEFDRTVCRLTMHHVQDPLRVLREMTRVCRKGGKVIVEDLFASEHPKRAAYQDRIDLARDPSHVRVLPLSELLQLFGQTGLEADYVSTADDFIPEVERWLATTETPADRAAEVRQLLQDDLLHDLSGTRPFQDATGKLFFHARTAIVAGRRFR